MHTAGVDIGGTSIKIGVFEDGSLISKCSVKTPFKDPSGVADLIAHHLGKRNVHLIGVGTAGSVDFSLGTVSASNLGWEEFSCAVCWRNG